MNESFIQTSIAKKILLTCLFLISTISVSSSSDDAEFSALPARIIPNVITVCRSGDIPEIEFTLTPSDAPFVVTAGSAGTLVGDVGARTSGEALRDEVEGLARVVMGPLVAAVLPEAVPCLASPLSTVEGIGRWLGMFILNPVVRTIVGKQPDESDMLGGCRVDIIIHNGMEIDLEWEKYDLRSGKIWSERTAPRIIEARNTVSFTASSRVPEPLGPEGFVQYKARDDSFRVRFYWNNPLETGAPTQARYTLLLGV